jgi:hypothetical protein
MGHGRFDPVQLVEHQEATLDLVSPRRLHTAAGLAVISPSATASVSALFNTAKHRDTVDGAKSSPIWSPTHAALLDEGISGKMAQTRLGHANRQTTLAL